MNWFEAWECGCGMPAPFAKRIRAIDAPVASSRHSIFSATPLSDFSRQGIPSLWIRISAGSMAPPRICLAMVSPSLMRCFSLPLLDAPCVPASAAVLARREPGRQRQFHECDGAVEQDAERRERKECREGKRRINL